jgi:plasmid maintenance system antidote protein VapI
MRAVHPGQVQRDDYLSPLNVPAQRINDIVRERRGVSADTAMRLAR